MRVCERCGRLHCAQCKPPETHCEAEIIPKRKAEEETKQPGAPQQDKKEEARLLGTQQKNEGSQLERNNPAAQDNLLRQLRERGPAPKTTGWIPRTVRPRGTTLMARLISESAQAAEQSWQREPSRMQHAGGQACLHTSHQAYYPASPRNRSKTMATKKDEIKESNQSNMLKEIRRIPKPAEKGEGTCS